MRRNSDSLVYRRCGGGSMSKLDNIEKLYNLKENGTITDLEFKREKQKILSSAETPKTKDGAFRLNIIGLILSIYSIVFTIISFYMRLGIFQLDLIVNAILCILALSINIKAKNKIKEKSILTSIGLGCSVISIIMLLPLLWNFIHVLIVMSKMKG